jgi:hypothetical protein
MTARSGRRVRLEWPTVTRQGAQEGRRAVAGVHLPRFMSEGLTACFCYVPRTTGTTDSVARARSVTMQENVPQVPLGDQPTPLRQCPRCGGWSLDPDSDRGHALGVERAWRGGPLPRLIYCTPDGREVRPIPPAPLQLYQPWGWTTSGYQPIDHKEEDQ